MSLDEIKATAPVIQALAAEDCALLLWAVWPELPGALDVIRSWGFEYKTLAFVWVKLNRSGEGLFTSMGFSTRCLLGGIPRLVLRKRTLAIARCL